MMKKNEFFPKYHKAVVIALGDNLEKTKPRVASVLLQELLAKISLPVKNNNEFARAFEEFLEDLGFAEKVSVNINNEILDIKVEGCSICEGNELLRNEGKNTFCPIIPTGLRAISKVLKKKATLLDPEKDDRVGYCKLLYSLLE